MAEFVEGDKRHRCCCSCVPVHIGSIIISILECIHMITLVAGICLKVILTQSPAKFEKDYGPVIYGCSLGLLALNLLAVILHFIGICITRHGMVIPHLIIQVFRLIIMIAMVVFFALAWALQDSIFRQILMDGLDGFQIDYNKLSNIGIPADDVIVALCGISIGVIVIYFTFSLWFFTVGVKCCRYLKEKRWWIDN